MKTERTKILFCSFLFLATVSAVMQAAEQYGDTENQEEAQKLSRDQKESLQDKDPYLVSTSDQLKALYKNLCAIKNDVGQEVDKGITSLMKASYYGQQEKMELLKFSLLQCNEEVIAQTTRIVGKCGDEIAAEVVRIFEK